MQSALRFVHDVLRGDVGPDSASAALRFRTRMQHLTGPLLAKALEDTFFYRYNRLLALNEVGGDPLARDGSVAGFHAKMRMRAIRQPAALTATSTHDTKRGEDARARLYTISEAPDLWVAAVERWRDMHRHLVAALPDGPAPEPNAEWMIYQALAGAWPPDFDAGNEKQLDELRQRFLSYLEKALREAKLRTDWTDNNSDYEEAVARYASALLSVRNAAFLKDFQTTLKPFVEAGLRNSLSQTLLKLTVPGIPDIYQGCEGLDFSLVDPDNRRPPDFEHLADSRFAAEKQKLIASVLPLRKDHPQLFTVGEYLPLEIEGSLRDHAIAFARRCEGRAAIVVVPRLVFALVAGGTAYSPEPWRGTRVILPDEMDGLALRNVVADEPVDIIEGALPMDALFAKQPCVLLISQPNR